MASLGDALSSARLRRN